VHEIVVFDTNILSSAIGWKGRPFQCVELARAGGVDGITCQELLDELTEKLESKLHFTADQALDSIVDLLTFLRPVSITGQLQLVTADPDDDKTVECAIYRDGRSASFASVTKRPGNPNYYCGRVLEYGRETVANSFN
jgi:uncharacterized protein